MKLTFYLFSSILRGSLDFLRQESPLSDCIFFNHKQHNLPWRKHVPDSTADIAWVHFPCCQNLHIVRRTWQMTTVKIAENCKASTDSPQDEKNLQHFQPFPANQKHYKNEYRNNTTITVTTTTTIYATSRCGGGGVLTYTSTTIANIDIKTIKNTTSTSTAITPQPQQQQQQQQQFSNRKGSACGGMVACDKNVGTLLVNNNNNHHNDNNNNNNNDSSNKKHKETNECTNSETNI